MLIHDEIIDGTVILHLDGKLMGGPDVDLFNGKLYRYAESDRKRIVIDLEKVASISSVGLGMLIGAMHSLQKRGGEMIVANVTEKIESLLILTKLVTVFNAKDSVSEALDSFDA